jgi:hypothetical protein
MNWYVQGIDDQLPNLAAGRNVKGRAP